MKGYEKTKGAVVAHSLVQESAVTLSLKIESGRTTPFLAVLKKCHFPSLLEGELLDPSSILPVGLIDCSSPFPVENEYIQYGGSSNSPSYIYFTNISAGETVVPPLRGCSAPKAVATEISHGKIAVCRDFYRLVSVQPQTKNPKDAPQHFRSPAMSVPCLPSGLLTHAKSSQLTRCFCFGVRGSAAQNIFLRLRFVAPSE